MSDPQSESGRSIGVVLSLPDGWVELPPVGSRGGMLRRDPYEQIARRLIAGGAVVPALLRSTRNYLERVAPREQAQIAGAAIVAASTADDAVLAAYAVFVRTREPGTPAGVEGLSQWVARPGPADSGPRVVRTVDLPVGPAVRGQWHQGLGDQAREVVQHWVDLEDRGIILLLTGYADSDTQRDRLVADFDAIAAGLRLVNDG